MAPAGRVVVNAPGPTPEVFVILAEALARHVKPEVAHFVRQVISLHDIRQVQDLFSNAGFRQVSVRRNTRTLRLPAPAEFLWPYVHSTPLAAALAQVDHLSRAALERDVVTHWEPFADDDGLMLQLGVVVATARTE